MIKKLFIWIRYMIVLKVCKLKRTLDLDNYILNDNWTFCTTRQNGKTVAAIVYLLVHKKKLWHSSMTNDPDYINPYEDMVNPIRSNQRILFYKQEFEKYLAMLRKSVWYKIFWIDNPW